MPPPTLGARDLRFISLFFVAAPPKVTPAPVGGTETGACELESSLAFVMPGVSFTVELIGLVAKNDLLDDVSISVGATAGAALLIKLNPDDGAGASATGFSSSWLWFCWRNENALSVALGAGTDLSSSSAIFCCRNEKPLSLGAEASAGFSSVEFCCRNENPLPIAAGASFSSTSAGFCCKKENPLSVPLGLGAGAAAVSFAMKLNPEVSDFGAGISAADAAAGSAEFRNEKPDSLSFFSSLFDPPLTSRPPNIVY
mmetsp:Transcript_4986/g.7202  ORF Transcript_4986/g.7202 Transcript_4986/m.7202 type:complete len:256 (+) Transcript_4986:745-1512(+)